MRAGLLTTLTVLCVAILGVSAAHAGTAEFVSCEKTVKVNHKFTGTYTDPECSQTSATHTGKYELRSGVGDQAHSASLHEAIHPDTVLSMPSDNAQVRCEKSFIWFNVVSPTVAYGGLSFGKCSVLGIKCVAGLALIKLQLGYDALTGAPTAELAMNGTSGQGFPVMLTCGHLLVLRWSGPAYGVVQERLDRATKHGTFVFSGPSSLNVTAEQVPQPPVIVSAPIEFHATFAVNWKVPLIVRVSS